MVIAVEDYSCCIFQGQTQSPLVLRRNCFHYNFSNRPLSHCASVIGETIENETNLFQAQGENYN